jgi:hypothetical protein
MNDPLSQALTPSTSVPPAASFGVRPLRETLEALRHQILTVLNEHFFDAGIVDEAIPVLHHTLIDSGSIRIVARRAEPAYEASVAVNARSVRSGKDDADRYEVEANGVLRRLRESRSGEHAFAIEIVPDADGSRSVDAVALTTELTRAIRRFSDEDQRG